MLAFVLAAGSGSRLRPLTDRIPKCLVPIAGKPLLSYTLELLVAHGVTRVVINSHHLPREVASYVDKSRFPLEIILAHEPTLLGGAGTLRAHRNVAMAVDEFLVIYGDNLTNANLSKLLAVHRQLGKVATLGLFRTANPNQCGIVSLDSQRTVVEFEEKPMMARSNLAFAGLLAAGPALVDKIPDFVPCDLGKNVLPSLVGQLGGWEIEGYLRDVGTPDAYRQAQAEVHRLYQGMA
jgi:mannose-1-phosphate guanylyltransferase